MFSNLKIFYCAKICSEENQSRTRVRARWAAGGAAPDSGKAIIFRAKAKFFGQKPAAKNEIKYIFCIY